MQHQFEDVYWERSGDWEYTSAALKGSSFYKLPKVLQWFSGNIGFHHIHHLSPRIPNYNLERCHKSDPMFQDVQPVTLLSSLKSLSFRLWDESAGQLSWDIDLATFAMEVVFNRRVALGGPRRFEFVEKETEPPFEEEGLEEFLQDASLSGDATEEEIEFLKKLRFKGKRPTALYYYRALQDLRDPLHFRPSKD